jgi:hypothetical protein
LDTTLIIFGILPIVVSIALIAGSIYSLIRRPSTLQVLGVCVALPLLGWSLLILYSMVRGAWPTFIPYYIIGAVLPLVGVQLWRALRRLPNHPMQWTGAAQRGFEVQTLSGRGPGH